MDTKVQTQGIVMHMYRIGATSSETPILTDELFHSSFHFFILPTSEGMTL